MELKKGKRYLIETLLQNVFEIKVLDVTKTSYKIESDNTIKWYTKKYFTIHYKILEEFQPKSITETNKPEFKDGIEATKELKKFAGEPGMNYSTDECINVCDEEEIKESFDDVFGNTFNVWNEYDLNWERKYDFGNDKVLIKMDELVNFLIDKDYIYLDSGLNIIEDGNEADRCSFLLSIHNEWVEFIRDVKKYVIL
jgi:hypothetical protein